MILALLINILELLAIVYLLWLLFEQVMNNEHFNDLLECAAKELDYKAHFGIFTGCILEKTNGQKILLEQLRNFDNDR